MDQLHQAKAQTDIGGYTDPVTRTTQAIPPGQSQFDVGQTTGPATLEELHTGLANLEQAGADWAQSRRVHPKTADPLSYMSPETVHYLLQRPDLMDTVMRQARQQREAYQYGQLPPAATAWDQATIGLGDTEDLTAQEMGYYPEAPKDARTYWENLYDYPARRPTDDPYSEAALRVLEAETQSR
jgi:hypothetical protein